MNLYLVNSNKHIKYDSYDGYVIRAETPERAVAMAQEHPGDEKKEAWDLDHIELLAENVPGEEKEILSSFNAG